MSLNYCNDRNDRRQVTFTRRSSLADRALTAFSREGEAHRRLVHHVRVVRDDHVLCVGAKSAALLTRLVRIAEGARIVAVERSSSVIDNAKRSVPTGSGELNWFNGELNDQSVSTLWPMSKAVCYRQFFDRSLEDKSELMKALWQVLMPRGELYILDYGKQRTMLMRLMYGLTVQLITETQRSEFNARGVIPELMVAAGFEEVSEVDVLTTPTGSLSIYRAIRPEEPVLVARWDGTR